MWLSYAREIPIVDLESGCRHLFELFSNLQYDAEHESVYGLERFMSYSECKNLAKKYEKGKKICHEYLENNDIEIFVKKLMKLVHVEFSQLTQTNLDLEKQAR